ncbi:hypothetical protein RCL1_000107 [Eukaryota sp. TZLM3-RCL]
MYPPSKSRCLDGRSVYEGGADTPPPDRRRTDSNPMYPSRMHPSSFMMNPMASFMMFPQLMGTMMSPYNMSVSPFPDQTPRPTPSPSHDQTPILPEEDEDYYDYLRSNGVPSDIIDDYKSALDSSFDGVGHVFAFMSRFKTAVISENEVSTALSRLEAIDLELNFIKRQSDGLFETFKWD